MVAVFHSATRFGKAALLSMTVNSFGLNFGIVLGFEGASGARITVTGTVQSISSVNPPSSLKSGISAWAKFISKAVYTVSKDKDSPTKKNNGLFASSVEGLGLVFLVFITK
jgi:hypothetical protein